MRVAFAALALALAAASNAMAQNWPAKPIRWVVPFPPGASADMTARMMSPGLTEQFGQPVLIDNRAGAASIIAMELVAKSAPDGITILFGNPTVVTSPVLYKMSFDPMKELAPVIQLTTMQYVMLASNPFPAKSVAEVLAMARDRPGTVTCASGGGMSEFGCGMFQALGKVNVTQVRYKGNALAMNDLVSGQVNVMFDLTNAAFPHVSSGRVRALAITGPARSTTPFPGLPTVTETIPDYQLTTWQGVFARSGTAVEIIARINRAIDAVIRREEVRRRLADLGVEIVGGTPEAFTALVRADNIRYSKLIRELNLSVE